MNRSAVTWVGLAAVALAAAVLSFDALRSLAIACGTSAKLAWLLPVCIEAAVIVATLVWLSDETPHAARQFARWLSLGMIVLSVAGNATDHFLGAYGVRPPWWTVVAVSSVPPVVLGAVAHLVALSVAKGTHEPSAPAMTSDFRESQKLADPVSTSGVPAGPLFEGDDVPLPTDLPQERPPVSSFPGAICSTGPDHPANPGTDPHPTGTTPVQTRQTARPDRYDDGPTDPGERSDDDLMVELRALAERFGGRPSLSAVRTGLGIGSSRAYRLLDRYDTDLAGRP